MNVACRFQPEAGSTRLRLGPGRHVSGPCKRNRPETGPFACGAGVDQRRVKNLKAACRVVGELAMPTCEVKPQKSQDDWFRRPRS